MPSCEKKMEIFAQGRIVVRSVGWDRSRRWLECRRKQVQVCGKKGEAKEAFSFCRFRIGLARPKRIASSTAQAPQCNAETAPSQLQRSVSSLDLWIVFATSNSIAMASLFIQGLFPFTYSKTELLLCKCK